MKTTERVLILNIVLVLLLMLVPAAALADVEMKPGETVTFTREENSEESAVFTFIPKQTGEYCVDAECPYMNVSGESLVLFAQEDGEPRRLYAENIGEKKSCCDEKTGEEYDYYSISFPYELQAGVKYRLSFGIDSAGTYKAAAAYLGDAVTAAEVNEETFPDENFRAYVSDNLDFNGDGILSENEIANIKIIDIENRNVASVEGIDCFGALTELYCGGNQIEELYSLPMNLTALSCQNNKLTDLWLTEYLGELLYLDCSDNQLTGITLNADCGYCGINVSGNSFPDCKAVTGKDIEWDGVNFVFGVQNHEHDLSCKEEIKATCNNRGQEITVCSKCDYYDSRAIEPVPHTYGDSGRCTVCGTYNCQTGEAEHDFSDHKCAKCGIYDCVWHSGHSFDGSLKCGICGEYACMLDNTDTFHEFGENGCCTVCGNSIPEPYTADDGSVWTLTKDGVLKIQGAKSSEDYKSACGYFYAYLKNAKIIECTDGTTYFEGCGSFANAVEIRFGRELETVNAPDSLAFLETISVDAENEYLCTVDGVLYSKDKSLLLIYPACKGRTEKSAVFDPNVRCIGEASFYAGAFESLAFPEGLETISDRAFMFCYDLKTVYLPSSVSSIGNNAFCDSQALKTIYFGGTQEQWNEISKGEENTYLQQAAVCHEHRHSYAEVDAVEVSCTEDGCTAGRKCVCGMIETGCEVIQASGHSVVCDDGTAATCTKIGTGAGSYCENCGTIISGCEDIPALGHDFPGAKAATCTETGNTGSGKCTRCDETIEGEVLPALGHSYSSETIAPTCTERGYTAYTCSTCGYGYTDDYVDANGHVGLVNKAIAATCTESGLTEGRYCEVCKEVFAKQETIPALGHKEVTDAAVAATCTASGLTEGKHCSVCNAILVKQEITTVLDHTEATDAAIAATCTKTGLTEGKHCSVCKEVLVAQEAIPALGHTEVTDAAVAATCTKTGLTEGKHCSACETVLVKQEETPMIGHKLIEREAVEPGCVTVGHTTGTVCYECGSVISGWNEIPALGHDFRVDSTIEPTCTKKGYTGTSKCSRCEAAASGKAIPALGHKEVTDAAVAATCTATGLTEGKHCSVCNEVFAKQEAIPALGHTEVTDAAVAATCTATGLTEGKHCSVCDTVLTAQETVPMAAHEYKDGVCTACNAKNPDYVPPHTHSYTETVTAPTCTEKGYTTHTCACGDSYKDSYVDAKGHTEVTDAAVAATCTATGLTEGKHCSECNEIFVKQEVVPALAHDYKDGVCTVCKAKDPSVNPFKDVAETSPYADAISWAYANDITKGKTDDSFGVNDGCTRAQIVTLLWREAGSPAAAADTVNPFTDVSADSEYYDAIMWAIANGITYGTTATTFSPDAVCTRGQIVTFMYRAAGSPKVSTGTGFTDVDASSYCCDAVAWAVANGITNGKTDTTFAPSETCTRGQAVTFMYRASADK